MGTLIVGIILGIIIIFAVYSYVKQLKKGGCGCGCSNCSKGCSKNTDENK